MLKKILLMLCGAFVVAAVAGAATLYWLVALHPGREIQEAHIKDILARESPVFYSDGVHRVGVFFEKAHRQYVPYAEIPKAFVNAIVAAEDSTFFENHGVDLLGILRALIADIRAGRVVQGGSTITQQTAKNLFKRRDRSITSKIKELINAWRLEYHYSKEKILEFYANQFYVSGNGRGLGVAARYYFDTKVSDLTTLECAFIAGSVQSPGTFNPFTKTTEEGVQRAKKMARRRTDYVLRQMYRLGMINPQTFQQCLGSEIPFKQGRMQYSLNTIMDLVKEALNEPEAREAFSAHGIDNIATSGIRVITTVERGIQVAAEQAERQDLSRLDVRLRGYDRKAVQKEYAALAEQSSGTPEPGDFLFGRIVAVKRAPEPAVQVSFDLQNIEKGDKGRIDQAGLMGLLDSLVKYEKERWTEATPVDLPLLLRRLKPGDLVYVRVRKFDPASGAFVLDLEKYPKVQGGVLVLKDGTIRAMVGGFENHYYNRAVTARRPVGSTMKPLVYAAAMQLGWNSTDILQNQRNLFIYQGEAYFPRPDHPSPYRKVSMSWAGTKSENVASVWLLYHLCDKLSPAQFKEVVAHLGLSRQPDESYSQYRRRIRDRYGVVVDDQVLYRTAFAKAVTRIEPDLIFDGRIGEYQALQTFHYSADLAASSDETATAPENQDEQTPEEIKEEQLRQKIMGRNFERFWQLRQEVTALRQAIAAGRDPNPTNLYYHQGTQACAYGVESPGDDWTRVSSQELHLYLDRLGEDEQQAFWSKVKIENTLSVATLDLLEAAIEKEYQQLTALPAYSEQVLYQLREFRVLTGLRYVIGLSRDLGIESPLKPVLSFPLGSNVISLLDLARAYQGLITGKSYLPEQKEGEDDFAIIDRVEDSDGNVIFVPPRQARQVVGPRVSLEVSDILRQVVEHGTGQYADHRVRLHSADPRMEQQLQQIGLSVPVLGKTGTANRFTNATFAGYVPGRKSQGDGVTFADGYMITSYVGFDDNAPMVRTSTHITGAAGALPLWTRVANGVVRTENYVSGIDLVDFYFNGQTQLPLRYPALGQTDVTVDEEAGGLPLDGATAGADPATIVSFGKKLADGRWQPARFFQPYWQVTENGS